MVKHFGRGERQVTNRAGFHDRRSSRPLLRSAGTPCRIPADLFKEKDGIRDLGNHTLPGFFVLLARWRGRPRTHAESGDVEKSLPQYRNVGRFTKLFTRLVQKRNVS